MRPTQGLEQSPGISAPLVELFGIDVRSLAAFRLAIAAILLGDLADRARFLELHYSDAGAMPRHLVATSYMAPTHWSLHMLGGSWQVQAVLFLIAALLAGMLLVGYRTRLATVGSWLLLVSLHSRNPAILNGGDMLLRCLLFWAMFLPLGSYFSLDRRRTGVPPVPKPVCSAATAAISLQICLMYLFSCMFKNNAAWRQDLNALDYAFQLDTLTKPLAHQLLDYPELLRLITSSTFFVEGYLPFLLFVPYFTAWTRPPAILIFASFHLATFFTMEIGWFPWVCLAALLLLIPSSSWTWLGRMKSKLRGRSTARVDSDTATIAPESPPSKLYDPARLPFDLVVIVCFTLVVLWNLRSLNPDRWSPWMPRWGDKVVSTLRIEQKWNMFDRPLRDDGWFVIAARLRDGSQLDLVTQQPVTDDKPAVVSATFPSFRWRLHFVHLWKNRASRKYMAAYLHRAWNRQHQGTDRELVYLEMYYWQEYSHTDGPSEPRRLQMYPLLVDRPREMRGIPSW